MHVGLESMDIGDFDINMLMSDENLSEDDTDWLSLLNTLS